MLSVLFIMLKLGLIVVWGGSLATFFHPHLIQFQELGMIVMAVLAGIHSLECWFFLSSPKFSHISNKAGHSIGVFIFGAFHLIPLLQRPSTDIQP